MNFCFLVDRDQQVILFAGFFLMRPKFYITIRGNYIYQLI